MFYLTNGVVSIPTDCGVINVNIGSCPEGYDMYIDGYLKDQVIGIFPAVTMEQVQHFVQSHIEKHLHTRCQKHGTYSDGTCKECKS